MALSSRDTCNLLQTTFARSQTTMAVAGGNTLNKFMLKYKYKFKYKYKQHHPLNSEYTIMEVIQESRVQLSPQWTDMSDIVRARAMGQLSCPKCKKYYGVMEYTHVYFIHYYTMQKKLNRCQGFSGCIWYREWCGWFLTRHLKSLTSYFWSTTFTFSAGWSKSISHSFWKIENMQDGKNDVCGNSWEWRLVFCEIYCWGHSYRRAYEKVRGNNSFSRWITDMVSNIYCSKLGVKLWNDKITTQNSQLYTLTQLSFKNFKTFSMIFSV